MRYHVTLALAATGLIAVPAYAQISNWVKVLTMDEITDQLKVVLQRDAHGTVNDIKIELTCSDAGWFEYSIAGFKKNHRPAAFNTAPGTMTAVFRIDKGSPGLATPSRTYNNEVLIQGRNAAAAVKGQQLTVRIQFQDSLETYVVSQDPTIFSACRAIGDTARRAAQDKAARLAPLQARLDELRTEHDRIVNDAMSRAEDPTPRLKDVDAEIYRLSRTLRGEAPQ